MYHCLQSSTLLAVALTLISVLPAVLCGPVNNRDVPSSTPATGIDLRSLVPSLSPDTKIYLPGSSEFTTYTVRWSNLEPPTPNIVIAPATEEDVAKVVRTFSAFNGFGDSRKAHMSCIGQVRFRTCYSHTRLQWPSWHSHYTGQNGLRHPDLSSTVRQYFCCRRRKNSDSRRWC
jgi:hypothetical protein